MSTVHAAAAALTVTAAIVAVAPVDSRATSPAILATPWTELHSSRVRLIAGPNKTAAGQYVAGLEIVLADGWKTYWRMPGDSGVPPSFDWAQSTNLAAAKTLYPAPIRMPEAGGTAIGYKNTVVLPIEITPKDASKPVALKVALEFGLCRDICIPVSTTFDLSIPPRAAGPLPPEIAAALDRVPRPQQNRSENGPDLKRAYVTADGSSPKLVIEAHFPGGDAGADAFIEAPEGFYVPIPKRIASDGKDVVRFESDLGRDLAQDLKGKPLTITLVSPKGGTEVRWSMP